MKTALIICTYNRFAYTEKCFDSIAAMKEIADFTIIVDDASTDRQLKESFADLKKVNPRYDVRIELHIKKKRKGIKDSLLIGFNKAFELGCDLAINLDSDAIVKPNFISRLVELKERFPDRIVSGFNCNNPRNPVLFEGNDYVERRHCNGINMAIDKQQYETIVRPALLGNGNWDFNSTHNNNFIISKPSLVQHLAPNDSTMGHVGGDVACDFYEE